jgi:hypothetical protein
MLASYYQETAHVFRLTKTLRFLDCEKKRMRENPFKAQMQEMPIEYKKQGENNNDTLVWNFL